MLYVNNSVKHYKSFQKLKSSEKVLESTSEQSPGTHVEQVSVFIRAGDLRFAQLCANDEQLSGASTNRSKATELTFSVSYQLRVVHIIAITWVKFLSLLKKYI